MNITGEPVTEAAENMVGTPAGKPVEHTGTADGVEAPAGKAVDGGKAAGGVESTAEAADGAAETVDGAAEAADGAAEAAGTAAGGKAADGAEATARAADGADEAAGTAADGHASARERQSRRPARFRRAVAAALLLALAGGGLQVMSARARNGPVTRNRALVDTETTSVVIGDVSNGLAKVFSYTPDSTATTEQAAADVLGGAALAQYRTLFAQVKEHAAAERLTVTTHVVRAGVTRLTGNTAQLLVFLDQVVVRKDRPEGTPAAAQLSVTARRAGGHWRIVDIHAR